MPMMKAAVAVFARMKRGDIEGRIVMRMGTAEAGLPALEAAPGSYVRQR